MQQGLSCFWGHIGIRIGLPYTANGKVPQNPKPKTLSSQSETQKNSKEVSAVCVGAGPLRVRGLLIGL